MAKNGGTPPPGRHRPAAAISDFSGDNTADGRKAVLFYFGAALLRKQFPGGPHIKDRHEKYNSRLHPGRRACRHQGFCRRSFRRPGARKDLRAGSGAACARNFSHGWPRRYATRMNISRRSSRRTSRRAAKNSRCATGPPYGRRTQAKFPLSKRRRPGKVTALRA